MPNHILQPQHRRHRNPQPRHLPRNSRSFIPGRLDRTPLRHLDPQSPAQPISGLDAQGLDGRAERHAHFRPSDPVDSEFRTFVFLFFLPVVLVLLLAFVGVGTKGHTARPPGHRDDLHVRVSAPVVLRAMFGFVEYVHAFALEETAHRRVGFPVVDHVPLAAHGEGEGGCFEEDGEELGLELWWWGGCSREEGGE